MLKNLISSLPLRKAAKLEAPVPTLDISRVIKSAPQPPEDAPAPAAEITSQAEPDERSLSLDDDLGERAEQAVGSLSSQFEIWMRMDLDVLIDAWKAAQQADPTPEKYRAVFVAAHNIKGAAPSYGYPSISRLCGSLCRLLTDTKPGENSALINLHVEACKAAFAAPGKGSGSSSVADAVCDALEQGVALRVSGA